MDSQREAESLARRYHVDSARACAILERISHGAGDVARPLLAVMLQHLPAQVALLLLETEDIGTLIRRHTTALRLVHADTPLVTVNELAEIIDGFIDHSHRNRQDLLDAGLPRIGFSRCCFLDNHLGKLYYTRLPIGIGMRQDANGEVTYRYTWSTAPIRPEPGDSASGEGASVSLIEGLSATDAEQLEAKRRSWFDLKLRVLRTLAAALRRQEPRSLWPDCLRHVSDALTYTNASFYLRQDAVYHGLVGLNRETGEVDTDSMGLLPGGLSDLLEFVGHCEQEVTIGTLHRAKIGLLALSAKIGATDWRTVFGRTYWATLSEPWHIDLDAILDQIAAGGPEEQHFWDDFVRRVNDALETEFSDEITITTRIRRPLRYKFGPYLQTFAAWTAAHLEGTGTLPQITLAELAPSPPSQPPDTFRKTGGYWTIVYRGKTFQIKHRKGLQYITCLLERPGQQMHVIELVRSVEKSSVSVDRETFNKMTQAQLDELNLSKAGLGDAGPAGDLRARAAIREQVKELRSEIDDAEANNDSRRAERARDELDHLQEYLASTFGLGGRPRPAVAAAERARVNVTKQITACIDDIAATDSTLGHHLRAAIKTGTFCVYAPEIPPDWQL